jgi:F-type H+-transporting ATPase subunit b
MSYLVTTGTAGVIEINGTVIVEILTFLIMLAVLARYVYPEVVKVAEARRRAIAEELREAEEARAEAQQRLEEAKANLEDARKTAQQVIDAANKSGQQARQELKEKAEEEARRIADASRKEIEGDRERALQSARSEVATLVVAATEKVIGETLDDRKHRELIERAIEEVASGDGRR